MSSDHIFDWHAFKFSIKVLVLCLAVAAVGRLALLYAAAPHPAPAAASPSLVLIQETHSAPSSPLALTLSTTTSEHVIATLAVADAVPPSGKFIAADLTTMVLTLYKDGVPVAKYPILAKGAPGTPYETPTGIYAVTAKEPDHLNNIDEVHLPWRVQFYGNYSIHGWPQYESGTPVSAAYTGDCIELNTADAKAVYDFADDGTGIFVYTAPETPPPPLALDAVPAPAVSADSYLVADIDTGDVFLEQNAEAPQPVASVTKLMTALAANETIPLDTLVAVPRNELTQAAAPKASVTFFAGDLLYPLLMQSGTAVADRLAEAYGAAAFVNWMNTTALALDMHSTHFADASGASAQNVSTTDDLFRLAAYLAHEKSLVLEAARAPGKELIAGNGSTYGIRNTAVAKQAMLSVFSLPVNGATRRVAVIVLSSDTPAIDTTKLTSWFTHAALQGATLANTACVSCAPPPPYRKIQL